MSRRRGEDVVRGTRLEKWLPNSDRVIVKDYGDHFHVNITFVRGGGHVSGNVDKYSYDTSGVHWVLYSYDEQGKHMKGEDIIITE